MSLVMMPLCVSVPCVRLPSVLLLQQFGPGHSGRSSGRRMFVLLLLGKQESGARGKTLHGCCSPPPQRLRWTGIIFFFLKIYLFIFREGREGERERERNFNVWLLGAVACNPGMCPDWESNLQHFGSQPMLNPLSYASQGWNHFFDDKLSSL
ncbi:hypothetical protein HJG60_010473 [Phyllostomus discolor]|uniref:Uncharacterized protein n=1 Tax=Phyllostomus discolor TaxID=89673 RepID=A0A834APC5_9CHIR|nr:hypothetical protein HJG60_010473 [Phyllostomus discolor]